MPRSSRHKSSKQHKHESRDGRNYSDSEGEGVKEVKGREEAPPGRSGGRGSREGDAGEKRKGRDPADEQGSSAKRRKEGLEAVGVGSDRWDGREKSKVGLEGKSKSSRSGDRKDDVLPPPVDGGERKKDAGKVEFDRKGERDSSRKDSYEHKDGRERDRGGDGRERDRGGDREKKAQDGRRSDKLADGYVGSESEHARRKESHGNEDSRDIKREVEKSERKTVDNVRVDKELEKHVRRKAIPDNRDAKIYEVVDTDDRRHSSREDHAKYQRHKDEGHDDHAKYHRHKDEGHEDHAKYQRHKDGHKSDTYKEKRIEDHEKDDKMKYESHRRQQYVTERSVERSGGKLVRDESRVSDGNHKKTKLQMNDYEKSHFDDGDARYSDHKQKRYPDNSEHFTESKSRDTKEQHIAEKMTPSGNKFDFSGDGRRAEPHHKAPLRRSPKNEEQKKSPSSSTRVEKIYDRHSSKGDELPNIKSVSEETRQRRSSSRDVPDRVVEPPFIEKPRILHKVSADDVASLPYNKSPKIIERSSSATLREKSPTSGSGDRKYVNRANLRRNFDHEEARQGSGFRNARGYSAHNDRGQDKLSEKGRYDRSHDRPYRDHTPASSSFGRTGFSTGRSRSPLPPSFPNGPDNSFVMTSSEDDFINEVDERKVNHRYKRSGESGNMAGRGPGNNAWQGIPTWQSPMPNGFVPYQQGPNSSNFLQPFPRPLYGVRPPLDLNHAAVNWHDPLRPFGWQNHPDELCPPLMHGWDASNGVIGDESHVYGRQSWEQNRQLMSNKGWELNSDAWRAQNGNLNVDMHTQKKEYEYSFQNDADNDWSMEQSNKQIGNEESLVEHSHAESTDVKPVVVSSTDEKSTEPSIFDDSDAKKIDVSDCQKPIDNNASRLHFYLSKVDISVDLVRPELYEQRMNIIRSVQRIESAAETAQRMNMNIIKGIPDGNESVTKNEQCLDITVTKEVNLEDSRPFWKHPFCNVQKLLFPATTQSIFEESMAQYKKQTELNEWSRSSLVSNLDLEKLSIVENVEVAMPSDTSSNAVEQEKNESSSVNASGALEREQQIASPVNLPAAVEQEEQMGSPARSSPNGMKYGEKMVPSSETSPVTVNQEDGTGLSSDSAPTAMELDEQLGIDDENILVDESDQPMLPQSCNEMSTDPNNTGLLDEQSSSAVKVNDHIGSPEAMLREESIECTVNLSRIHHSPESTH